MKSKEKLLYNAVQSDDVDLIKRLVERGADVQWEENICVRIACRHAQFEVVKYLIEHNAKLNDYNYIALTWAAGGHTQPERRLKLVKYLIEHCGVNANANSNRPISSAFAVGNTELVAYLITKGADYTKINIVDPVSWVWTHFMKKKYE